MAKIICRCVVCHVPIARQSRAEDGTMAGVSISGDPHDMDICEGCWGKLTVEQRLNAAWKWQLLGPLKDALIGLSDLTLAAKEAGSLHPPWYRPGGQTEEN